MATKIPHPGSSEQGMLADLKAVAEEIGSDVFGFPVRWDVENLSIGSAKRPDVIVYRADTNATLASGEAKRPDAALGEHALVASEVDGALAKASHLGLPACFTTNFFEVAVWNAEPGSASRPERLIDSFDMVHPSVATTPQWWKNMPAEDRNDQARAGLKQLFERLRTVLFGGGIIRDVNEVVLTTLTRLTDKLVASLHAVMIRERDMTGLPTAVVDHGAQAALDVVQDDQARYLVAQGVAEVMTAALFYRNITDHFSLNAILGGTNPSTGKALAKTLNKSLLKAKRESGDYETIFDLTATATWCIQRDEHAIVAGWKALLEFVDSIDFEAISSDVLGTIFERLISPERRHAMGQHYTQPRIARSMVKWAIRDEADTVADVSCGAGTFLVEAYQLYADRGVEHAKILDRVFGNDLDPFAVHLAAVNLATRDIFKGANYPAVRHGDAFGIRPGDVVLDVHPLGGVPFELDWPADGLDVMVGNPPYADAPADPTGWRKAITLLNRHLFPKGLTGGNQAAWFALLAQALLKDEGRWALVLPVSVLQNSNLVAWRGWLRTGRNITIWHTEIDVWFSDARVATCVILAEPVAAGTKASVKFVEVNEAVVGDYQAGPDGTPIPGAPNAATVVDLSKLPLDADLLIPGTTPAELRDFAAGKTVAPLTTIPGIGVASGNKLGHGCYQLKDAQPDSNAAIRHVASQQMDVALNKKYLLPFLSGPKDERTGEFNGGPNWILNAPAKIPSGGALAGYIAHCVKIGVPGKPSIKAQGKEWWHRDWHTTQVAVQIHPGFTHQVWWSDTAFVPKNNFHLIRFDSTLGQHHRELVAASLASAYGALASLFLSSEVGCEGVRWLSTPQFAEWPVLDPTVVDDEDAALVLEAYRRYRKHAATEMHVMPPEALDDWRDLTARVAKAGGVKKPAAHAAAAIEQAREACVRRTDRETLALAGRTRTGTTKLSKSNLGRRAAAVLGAAEPVTELLDLLTGGDEEVELRGAVDASQGMLDLGNLTPVHFNEGNMADVLGIGFHCVPVLDDEAAANRMMELATETRDLLRKELLPVTEAAKHSAGFIEMQDEIDRHYRHWMQSAVRRRLT